MYHPTRLQGPGIFEDLTAVQQRAELLATNLHDVLSADETQNAGNAAEIFASELLQVQINDDERQQLRKHLETGSDELLLPIASRSLEPLLPTGIDSYPRSKQRMIENYSKSSVKPVIHFAVSLLAEFRASGGETREDLARLISLELGCADFLRGNALVGQNLQDTTTEELARNTDNLALLTRIAAREGVALDAERLMKIQPAVFEMLTSNASITTVDINYRKKINAMPGAAHSLQAPSAPDTDRLLSRYGDYIDFIEATASTKRGGYASTFGFLHRVGIDEAGNPFMVEHPHTMFDQEILSIDHPIVENLKTFEQDFQRTHDMLHNALPVFAEHFMIHHPSAPITLGGYLPEYVAFGEGMRKDKSSYELALAILHKQIMQERFAQDPALLESHVSTVRDILTGLADMQARGLCSDKAIDHMSFVVMSGVANIMPHNSAAYRELASYYEQLRLPEATVRPRDVYKLLIQQEVVTPRDALLSDIPAGLTKDQKISQICKQVDDKAAVAGLRDLKIDYSDGEQGAEFIVQALRELGIEPSVMSEAVNLQGADRLRWLGITASSRRLKGMNEKIHGMQTVRFWDKASGEFTEVTPIALLGKFYDHFEQHAEEYDFRVWFRGFSNAALHSIKDLALNPKHRLLETASQGFAETTSIIDKCMCSLIDDAYEPLSDEEQGRLLALADRMALNGQTDASEQLKDCVAACGILAQEADNYSWQTGRTFVEARKALVEKLMSLDG